MIYGRFVVDGRGTAAIFPSVAMSLYALLFIYYLPAGAAVVAAAATTIDDDADAPSMQFGTYKTISAPVELKTYLKLI